MSILFLIILGIYIWRVSVTLRRGVVEEVERTIDVVMISLAVFSGITMIMSIRNHRWISFLVTMIVLLVISLGRKMIRLIFKPLQWFARLPLIRSLDRLVGLLLGIVEGTLISWVVLTLAESSAPMWLEGTFTDAVRENAFLLFLWENNILSLVLQILLGVESEPTII